ncbi:MAG TPA: hypothetical protein VKB59_14870 [Micromonosporaceae bacterium]|nr:hypothetical protein [Micromonosporaceae bacterium]
MVDRLPLPTLLSQALVAFTIEFDNEFEHRMPHRTAVGGGNRGPWLTSMAMWSNFMRLVPDGGVPLGEMRGPARITNLGGLERWGYVTVEPTDRPAADRWVRLTRGGRAAQRVWRPLADEIEQRWRERFGDVAIDELREALSAFADPSLPGYLPVVGYADGMRSDHVRGVPGAAAEDLAGKLSQVLLSFTLDYEAESQLSLPMSADVLRVIASDGTPVRDLPGLSGVSKEAIASSLGFLSRHGLIEVAAEPSQRTKVARLTANGAKTRARHPRIVAATEDRWRTRAARDVDRVRSALITGERLAFGLRPYPDGWRAHNPYRARTELMLADPTAALPHQPMVLHRGGYPDGS